SENILTSGERLQWLSHEAQMIDRLIDFVIVILENANDKDIQNIWDTNIFDKFAKKLEHLLDLWKIDQTLEIDCDLSRIVCSHVVRNDTLQGYTILMWEKFKSLRNAQEPVWIELAGHLLTFVLSNNADALNKWLLKLKVLAQKEDIDHISNAFKVLFFRNLIPNNKKEVIRFGIEKPINEIVEHLDNVSNMFNEFKSIIEQMIQAISSELSPENQIEARRCGLELPLDELVEKLSKIENIWKICGKIPVKALLDTSSKFNTISKSLFDKLKSDHGIRPTCSFVKNLYGDAI
ncbi:24466_t:CDS:2, partial [Gigaspora margarita]